VNVRIGVARRVHVAKEFLKQSGYDWGASLCGWAGTCTATEDEATCLLCKVAERKTKQSMEKKGLEAGP